MIDAQAIVDRCERRYLETHQREYDEEGMARVRKLTQAEIDALTMSQQQAINHAYDIDADARRKAKRDAATRRWRAER